jgi:hypothetical protein
MNVPLEENQEYLNIIKNKDLSKSQKKNKKSEFLYEKYGYLLNTPSSCLDPEHKANLGGGLKCFHLTYKRDKDGNKIKNVRKRCGNPAVKGSFFCKKHGGGNNYNIIHGRNINPMISAYKNVFNNQLGDLLDIFVNEEDILDAKPELMALRIVLNNHIKKLVNNKPSNPKRLLDKIVGIIEDEGLSNYERFSLVKDITDSVSTITDGDSIDRISRTVETISRVIERLHKIQSKDEFILTKEGLKIFLRAIVDIMNDVVEDRDVKNKFKEALLSVSVQTGGDLSKYHNKNVVDAEYTVED